jgi:lipoyl(octanoyl) transferase
VLDLRKRRQDVRNYVHALEGWVIAALGRVGIEAFRAPGRIGIWTLDHGGEAKIGAIGVRIRQWVTLHGFAVNLNPDLTHFTGIIPCGLSEFPVTSAAALGLSITPKAFDSALAATFLPFLDDLGEIGLEASAVTV